MLCTSLQLVSCVMGQGLQLQHCTTKCSMGTSPEDVAGLFQASTVNQHLI